MRVLILFLLLTFTRKAANEMMKRASMLLDDRCSKIRGGTFHSFANITPAIVL
jgi:DNA helicase-2/ATP-dependent DNA helicase PcrA